MTGHGGQHDRSGSGDKSPELLPDGGVCAADLGYSGFEEYELDWTYTVHLGAGEIEASLQRTVTITDTPDIDYFVGALRFDGEFPDSRARWHHNYTPIDRWVRAHILREARGFSIQEVAKYLNETPSVALWMGFWEEPSNDPEKADPPQYTQLRDMWEEEFSAPMQGAIRVLAQRLVECARNNGFPAPEKVFLPEDDVEADEVEEDDPTVRELTTEKTADIWEHARPMVLKHWHLKRHHNWQVPEYTFFDAHAYLATASDDEFPESGLGNMLTKSDHDRVHYPSTHRRELKKFTIEDIRELHREVTEDLIREARREGELIGKLEVAIDQTKGHPWTGEIERKPNGDNDEKWILGYKNDNDERIQHYFQWASVQIVGLDVPLVLDAVPVHRGYARGDIVDDLLETATDMVDDIERVYMDADYDSVAVKNAAEKHDVLYTNRKSRDREDKRRMREMWNNGEAVRIVEEEDRPGMPMRKKIYVPYIAVDDDEDEEEDDQDDGLRQELLSDFGDAGGESDEMPDESPFESLLDDMREEEERDKEDVDGAEKYVVFETNDPLADKHGVAGRDSIPKTEQRHAAARMVRKYGRRWGIENGYKKLGHFLPRSGSKDPVLRFFGFAFAATLYNCWRLVDLLVKLSVEDEPAYTPLVPASRFLAVAEGMFGLEAKPPPD